MAVLVLLFSGLLSWHWTHRNLNLGSPEISYQVPAGRSLTGLINDLHEQRIINVPVMFARLYARLSHQQGSVKAGEYAITENMNLITLLAHLRSGEVIQRSITFPEGWRFSEWRTHLQNQPLITQTLPTMTDAELMDWLGLPGQATEGQFFPDTYQYTRNESDVEILRRAQQRMQAVLADVWQNRSPGALLKTPYEALILASIVEKETGLHTERGAIASVFLNRLQRGMKLQTDPTVIYGVENFDGNLTRTHLRTRTPFNTYVIQGLPPTPICNPGLASLRAVLHPEVTDYLYFVARGDGSSYFSETLAEHNAAVLRYQKDGRVEDYRSAPGP
ncbi:MAG: endolytic transglycosylase MltG [Pseudomonadales bacterium]|nr:endolytic transglycosylase MltG [Pseudomonadales bacterium]